MDLGTKRPSEGVGPAEVKRPEVSYPSFNLNDKVAEQFHEEHDCKIGDEITATVKLKVTSLRSDEYGHSVGFDVHSLDDIKYDGKDKNKLGGSEEGEDADGDNDGDEAGEEDSADEEKILGYKRKSVKPAKETPDTSAKSLLD